MYSLKSFLGFGQRKTPAIEAGVVQTVNEEDTQHMLLNLGSKHKDEAPEGALFSASASDRRRAEAVYDAWMKRYKRGGQFTEQEVTVSPALAEYLLEHNPSNRRLSKMAITKYASDMAGGRWSSNGQPLIIASTGDLNDGQNRLSACVQAGVSFVTDVKVGASRESRETLDQGVRRTPGQQLTMMGYTDGNNLAHAGRVFWQLQTHGRVSHAPEYSPTWPQIQETIEEHQGLTETSFGHRAWRAKLGGVGLFVAMRYWCSGIGGPDNTEKFFEPVISALGFRGKTDPAYQLHKRLIEGDRLTEVERAAFIIKGWNAFRNGNAVRILKFLPGEEFPAAE